MDWEQIFEGIAGKRTMRNVSIVGVGQIPVGEHWELSVRHIAYHAIAAALEEAARNRWTLCSSATCLAAAC